ncbi:MAG: Stp1/IreP family PP2C-type Ser/Thr phosphatase [Ruminococcaceae bacterium]|nr:Stp1/IreP family PP2C-type Ser/Thr phosphatase [Oscillospiraceae bacterium]
MRSWGITDAGVVRHENQDSYDVRTVASFTSAIVCDGMGGVAGGRLASSIAVERFQNEIEQVLQESMSLQQIGQAADYAVSLANDAIRKRAAEEAAYQHMGTTLVCALARDKQVVIINVGDSRAYHISRDGIRQISRDHSLVEVLVERGDLTPEEAKHHPQRNLITRALGPDASVQTDSFYVEWKQGDFLLLCSDGLVNTVSDQEILFEVIHNGEPDTCLARLVALSRQRGAPDNVTAVLLMNI